jgi:hypothetical protein
MSTLLGILLTKLLLMLYVGPLLKERLAMLYMIMKSIKSTHHCKTYSGQHKLPDAVQQFGKENKQQAPLRKIHEIPLHNQALADADLDFYLRNLGLPEPGLLP